MTLFFQATACVMVAVVICCILNRQGSAVGVLLGVAVCAMVLLAAIRYLQPVLELMDALQDTARLSGQMMGIILKAVGIGLVTELTVLICADSGSTAMGRTLEILAAAAILWLSVPLMTALLELVQTIAGEL